MTSAAPTTYPPIPPLVGQPEIAAMFGVKLATVHQWRNRHNLPDPDAVVSGGNPVWLRQRILDWAPTTGRHPVDA